MNSYNDHDIVPHANFHLRLLLKYAQSHSFIAFRKVSRDNQLQPCLDLPV